MFSVATSSTVEGAVKKYGELIKTGGSENPLIENLDVIKFELSPEGVFIVSKDGTPPWLRQHAVAK